MRRKTKKKKAIKEKVYGKPQSWVVVYKDGEWNAAINNFVDTEKKLEKLGWEILGYPSFKRKSEAIDWIRDYCQAVPKSEKKK